MSTTAAYPPVRKIPLVKRVIIALRGPKRVKGWTPEVWRARMREAAQDPDVERALQELLAERRQRSEGAPGR